MLSKTTDLPCRRHERRAPTRVDAIHAGTVLEQIRQLSNVRTNASVRRNAHATECRDTCPRRGKLLPFSLVATGEGCGFGHERSPRPHPRLRSPRTRSLSCAPPRMPPAHRQVLNRAVNYIGGQAPWGSLGLNRSHSTDLLTLGGRWRGRALRAQRGELEHVPSDADAGAQWPPTAAVHRWSHGGQRVRPWQRRRGRCSRRCAWRSDRMHRL